MIILPLVITKTMFRNFDNVDRIISNSASLD